MYTYFIYEAIKRGTEANTSPLLHIIVDFIETEPSRKFDSIFDHFSRSFKVASFEMIRWCLDISDVNPANEHK